MAKSEIALGIDVGGTFTDVLALNRDTGKLVSAFKILSTPEDLAAGAVTGVDRYRERISDPAGAVFAFHSCEPTGARLPLLP